MAKRNKGLGTGLNALMNMNVIEDSAPIDDDSIKETTKTVVTAGFTKVPLDQIYPNPNQPRKHFNEEYLEELSKSIENIGLIQPITVIKTDDGYEIVAGERRYRACKMINLKQIPVNILNISQKEKLEVSLIENIQRENLNPIEIAIAYESLINSYDMTQEELASQVAKSRTAITNTLRLLNLNDEVQKMIIENTLSSGHGRAILSISDKKEQLKLAKYILAKGLSVREVEALVKKWPLDKTGQKQTETKKKREILSIERELQQSLQAKVKLHGATYKGKIQIEYYSQEELERILDILLK